MDPASPSNHYELLGIDVGAPDEEVEAGLARLIEQAQLLAYSSPEHSRELWATIRQIRRDLLTDAEVRAAYDRPLMPPEDGGGAGMGPSDATLIPFPSSRVVVEPPPSRQRLFLPLALLVVVLGLAGWFAYRLIGTGNTKPVRTMANRAVYPSGQHVTLRWRGSASLYRLEIATGSATGPLPRTASWRPFLTTSTQRDITVIGAQRYYWRVQGYVAGRWSIYTAPRSFQVARPAIAAPQLLRPTNGRVRFVRRIRVCWTPVKGAIGYRLWVTGWGTRTVGRPCRWITFPNGEHRWHMAALVKGARIYQGPSSPTWHFTISM